MTQPRLLIIDDEADICELIADVAEGAGFTVRTVSDPQAVAGILDEFKPECILMDLMMPGVDGVELLRDLQEQIKNCAIVLMSGHDARVLNSARRLGSAHGLNIVTTLEKPTEIPRLREILGELHGKGSTSAATKKELETGTPGEDELLLHYQPILDLANGQVRGVEALARWNHPAHGIQGPGEFLARFDGPGMDEFTRRIFRLAAAGAAAICAAGHDLKISVNMTYANLTNAALVEEMDAQCRAHHVTPDRFTVEVTESDAMRDVEHVLDVLTNLRLKGYGLAIDDFGIGYTSLRELQRLPFSHMKMDKSFITDLLHDKAGQIISHAIIELGHNLGLKVVAEGVETGDVLSHLKDRKCDFAQGYFISKPMAQEKLIAWLDAQRR